MQYMGGKHRQASRIVPILRDLARGKVRYLEPFLGGAAIAERMAGVCSKIELADAHADLVLMWQAILDGWNPPTQVTRDEYAALRTAEPSALRGFAGFGCSFGGKWFGGYASNARGDDFCGAARRGVLRKAARLREADAVVFRADYRELVPGAGDLVYCDPPYSSVTGYAAIEPFDSDAFWATMKTWAGNGATVVVSEYTAPQGVVQLWSGEATVSLRKDDNRRPATEKLFHVPGEFAA